MMVRIGIVISNHAAEPETERKLKEQYQLDEVRYFKHPDIDPRHSKEQVWMQADNFLRANGVTADIGDVVVAVINGEYGFSTACVFLLKAALFHNYGGDIVAAVKHDLRIVYPTTERGATEELQKDGSIKTTHVYKFVQFREW